jgi:hypothetical protein
MPGGVMNLVSSGAMHSMLFGNPSKTLWTSSYKQITNFGMQNFRLDYEGLRQLQTSSDTTYTFKVPRYGDLIKDTYLVFQLPDIYSPVYGNQPYEFNWIQYIGAMIIKSIKFTVGGALLQQLSGFDILAFAARDYAGGQFNKWCEMVGHTLDMYNPAVARGFYPNAIYHDNGKSEPSIRGRQIRVPLPIWWGQNSQQAFPLLSMQNQILQIEIVLRPIQELFQIRDITNTTGDPNNVIAPNMVLEEHQLYRFLQSPPETYTIFPSSWSTDIHLSTTFIFITDDERTNFITNEQSYLIREVYDTWFLNTSITDKLWLKNCNGMVLGWCIMMQRSDVPSRNEWSNFTNWPYDYMPSTIIPTTTFDANNNLIYETGIYTPINEKMILDTLGITIDGSMREESKPFSLFLYEQQLLNINGSGFAVLPGLFIYQFHTSPSSLQPSGSMNMAMYSKIELNITTITPPFNNDFIEHVICDPISGSQLGTVKPTGTLYTYNYNCLVVEERYNIVQFMHGNVGMLIAR